jgi:glc operon protein GlcG
MSCGVRAATIHCPYSYSIRKASREENQTMHIANGKRLTCEGAKKMMATAIGKAQEAKVAVSVAIVDAGGHLILLERMDGGRFHTVHSATTKAVCASSNKRPTSSQGAVGQALDVVHALGLALAAGPERWTPMEGGCPILVEGECIGGIGVAGGDWKFDADLAREAVESIGARAA